MSIGALLKGVEVRLRSAAVLDDRPDQAVGAVCGVQPDGAPPPGFGQWYYAVHFAGVTSADPNAQGLDWYYAVAVTVTRRMAQVPTDRRGARMAAAHELLDRAVLVAAALHQDDLHRVRANELIPGTAEHVGLHGGTATVNGFVEPLRVGAVGEVRPAPPAWTRGDKGGDSYTVEVRLRDARRVQYIGG